MERGARVIVVVYLLATLLSFLSWLEFRVSARRQSWVEVAFEVLNVPMSHSLTSLAVLTVLTGALLGRKRAALNVVLLFQVFALVISGSFLAWVATTAQTWDRHAVTAVVLSIVSGVVAVGALLWLWWLRPAFPGRLRPGSWWAATLTFVIGLAAVAAGIWLMLGRIAGWQTGRHLLTGLLLAAGDSPPGSRAYLAATPDWLTTLSSTVLGLTVIATVAVFLRSAHNPNRWDGTRELQLRSLLARHGDQDSLGYFATRRDKAAIFATPGEPQGSDGPRSDGTGVAGTGSSSPSGQTGAAVSYQVIQGVSLASGDPLGDPNWWGSAIRLWQEEARRYGWIPAVVSCSEAGARAYVAAGFRVVKMGDEAVIDPARFNLANTSLSSVRHAVNHARKAGLTVSIRRQRDLSADELATILAAADTWRGEAADRGFSMALNRAGDDADPQTLFVTAHSPDGALQGVLSFVPWGRRGVSLDVMRRSPTAPNGVTELMVTSLLADAETLGIKQVSLNFCMFRENFEEADRFGSGSWMRVQNSVLIRLDRFFQLERLYRSNVKYQPSWRPRFLCYDQAASLPRVLFAVGIAEGFLPSWLRPRPAAGHLNDQQLAEAEAFSQLAPVAPGGPRRSDQTRHRIEAARSLAAIGRDPWPAGGQHPTALGADTSAERCSGRVRAMRDFGGVVFVDLVDGHRTTQLRLQADTLGRPALREFSRLVNLGDLLEVVGDAGTSRSGHPVVDVRSWMMLAKSLHPFPFRSFTDPETRLRQRSIDLAVHPDDADYLRQRTLVVRSLRTTLDSAGYAEVETPMLHTVHGGASARPFRTHINAYDLDLSLRIAPELYLKRLLVAGLGPVYELGRNFRNEGADNTHNPEFTSLEVYQPGGDYTTMRELTELLIKNAAIALYGSARIPLRHDSGVELTDVGRDWPVVPVLQAVSEATGTTVTLETDFDVLLDLARTHEVHVADHMGAGAVIEELYAELVEAKTVFPTFYVDFPVETSPLTRPHCTAPGLVERWDLVVNRMELGTAYSELTDPLEQRRRLTEQSLKAAAGDPEAMEVDEDFLFALECGMPPTGGMGMGVDRLVMLLTATNIRSVLTFPFVKPLPRSTPPAASPR